MNEFKELPEAKLARQDMRKADWQSHMAAEGIVYEPNPFRPMDLAAVSLLVSCAGIVLEMLVGEQEVEQR